ncbi:hypothetical protein HMPREF9374_1930 [Desmospora sp. 8437]|nr:hypothetical protein HMPREF9374_1930 [Desmospora sp. 8437]
MRKRHSSAPLSLSELSLFIYLCHPGGDSLPAGQNWTKGSFSRQDPNVIRQPKKVKNSPHICTGFV